MSDVPPRPRIRPATSDDWQNDHSDRAGQRPPQGQEPGPSAPDFDNSTYYEYIERHTGDFPVSRTRPRNVFAPAGGSPFQGQSPVADDAQQLQDRRGQTDSPVSGRSVGTGDRSRDSGTQRAASDFGPSGPSSGPLAPQPQPTPNKGNGAKITVVIIAIVMILALLGFFGVRWLAPSTGTVPVDFGDSESPSPSPSDGLVKPTSSPEESLAEYTKAGTAKAGDLEGSWVTQVSAKNVGLEADGKTWTAQDILNEFEANRVKYPGAILIRSGDWDSYKDDNYWVTVIDTPYSGPEPALDQCRSWGLDRDHCLAKRLIHDGDPKGNSAYLDD